MSIIKIRKDVQMSDIDDVWHHVKILEVSITDLWKKFVEFEMHQRSFLNSREVR